MLSIGPSAARQPARKRARRLPARSCAIAALSLGLGATPLAGCNGDRAQGNPAQANAAASGAGPNGAANPQANPQQGNPGRTPGRTDPTCAASLDAASSKIQLRTAKGQLVLGVLAGLKDASDDNLAHLRGLVAELKRRGAELLIADGDLGDNSEAQEELLSALSSVELPLIVLAGNREVRSDLDAAEASLRKRGTQLYDLSHTRIVDLGDALVVGLPGVFDRRLLRADGACLYSQLDLDALAAWLDKLPPAAPPALLVAAVPPHNEGPQGIDFSDGQNVGEMRFIPLLTSTRARFGIFGQVWEAGGHAVDQRDSPVASAQFSNQLYLNPGAADRTPWPMNDGSTSPGLAALLTIRGRQAAYEPVREPPAPARSP